MTCAEVEIRLCDYVDGDLRGAQKSALEQHLAGCSGCTELAQDVQAAVGFIERAAIVEPPAELMTRILHQIPAGRQASAWRRLVSGFLGARLGGWFQSILQPRYVMGMAMTMLSFSMLARFAGIRLTALPVRRSPRAATLRTACLPESGAGCASSARRAVPSRLPAR